MSEQIRELWLAIVAAGIGGGAVGSLLTIFITHRLTIGRERMLRREESVSKDKTEFIFMIDELVETIKNCNCPDEVRLRFRRLFPHHLRFRPHIHRRRLDAYDEAWKKLQGTTSQEAIGSSNRVFEPSQSEELHAIQSLLISRLEAVRKIVHDT